MFSKIFGGSEAAAKISPIHTKKFVAILSKIATSDTRLENVFKDFQKFPKQNSMHKHKKLVQRIYKVFS